MLTEGSYRASSATRSIRSIRDWTLRKVPPKIEGVDPPALSIFPNHQDSKHLCQDLSWYNWWINDQLETIPHALLDLLPRTKRDLLLESSSPEIKIFHAIADLIKNDTNPSIDGTVEHLSELGLFQNRGDGRAEEGYRTLVFAFLGWQTMLYQPSFGTCPPQQLAILNNLDGYQGQAFLAFKQDQSSAKKRLDTFLMGFGLLFPPKNVCMSEEQEDIQAFETFKTIECQELNASVLNSIAHINIQWVDILAPHLEFNKATNTLYLFRYPSFCIANLPCDGKDGHAKGIIYGCAASPDSPQQWASEDDVTDYLCEVVLSYRLLFGQSKTGRQFFRRSMKAFEKIPPEGHDRLLPMLCGRKSVDVSAYGKERSTYNLERDFPMLRCRIADLKKQLSASKPRGWTELWRDKRDSAHWYTFWAVIIIGGAGLLLSILQVLLQVIQTIATLKNAP